ncbi:MAG: acetolactate decarboxylase [Parachlamydia sp.]|nr:MAG: acetolactate decarboxylase [Parachlamydia sp.]
MELNLPPHCLFQYSGIEAFDLLEYDGSLSVGQIKQYGDFGLGCFNALDGELIAFDNHFFHATSDGNLKQVLPHSLVSCVYMTHFEPLFQVDQHQKFELADLPSMIKPHLARVGQPFYALRIEALFDKISVRSVPPQKKPYLAIDEVVKQQALFEFENIEAVMIGFHFPEYLKGLTYAGFHLHFVTCDFKHGGHVLEFSAREGTIQIDPIESYYHLLPDYARNSALNLCQNSY